MFFPLIVPLGLFLMIAFWFDDLMPQRTHPTFGEILNSWN